MIEHSNLESSNEIRPDIDEFTCRLMGVGRGSMAASNSRKVISRSYHILQYTTGGSGAVHIGGKRHRLTAGDAILLYPNEPFRAEFDSDRFVRLYFRFDVHRLPGPSVEHELPRMERRVHRVERPSEFLQLLMNAKYEYHACSPLGTSLANSLFTQALITVLRGLRVEVSLGDDDVSRQKERSISYVKKLIEENCQEELTTSRLANPAQMSPTYLRKLFKKFTGFTIHEYIMRCRLEQSAMLLIDNRLPIKQIADICGFSTIHHFTRRFTQYFGKSPAAYSKEILNRVAI